MKAQRLHAQKPIQENPLTLEEISLPEPIPNQIRIKIKYCGVCHTDLHTVEGDIHPPSFPITPGHQVVGVVDKLGEGVGGKIKIGDRVGVPWLHQTCGECNSCQRGEENLCVDAKFTGFHKDGGFAEYILAQADFVLPIPENIPDELAAPLLCAGVIGYRSLIKANIAPGERVGLFGFGASAHLAIQVARHWDCEVFVFTRSEGHRQHAEELGAAWIGGAEDKPPKQLDRAVIFAPAGWIVPLALEKVRPGGTVAINAIHMSNIPEMPYQLIYGERTLRSVANATYQDGVEFLKLAAEIPVRATIQIYDLEDANQALEDMKNSNINGEGVLEII
jgi:propanol-preferring alcohol dehydrogenase